MKISAILNPRAVYTAIAVLLLFFSSCEKQAGEGGNCKITGKVWVKNFNSTFTQLISEYPATDEDIYIVYDDHNGYDDKVSTDYKGEFEFRYLRPGNYTIYVYSRDSSLQSASGKTAIIKEVEINKSKEEVILPEIVIYK